MRTRLLLPSEVTLHRELRLRALRESPDSFGETVADAEARPLSYWEALTLSITEPGRHIMVLAIEGESVCGSTYGLRDRDRGDLGRVGGMWVASRHRRRGAGSRLLQAVCAWAREQELTHLRLWVPSQNIAALTLYRHAGFNDTGQRRTLPTRSDVEIIEQELRL